MPSRRGSMKRLGYKKSHAGCVLCKARRVKCDEGRPCGACRRHSVPCSLDPSTTLTPAGGSHEHSTQEPTLNKPEERSPRPTCPSPMNENRTQNSDQDTDRDKHEDNEDNTHASPGEIPYFSKFRDDPQPRWGMDVGDLELMHHYTHVSYRISFFTNAHKALQADVPQQAFLNPYLLHQILAFSAFHLAYLRPDSHKSYQLRASQHQAKAISGIRVALEGSLTHENCHSLYASSIFLIMSAFSTLPGLEVHNPSFLPIESLADIFVLIAGMSVLLSVSQQELRNGPLQALFAREEGSASTPRTLQAVALQLQSLKDRLAAQEALSAQSEDSHTVVMSGITSFIDAITEVQQRCSLPEAAQLKVAFLWPIRLGNEFVELIRQKHPPALSVLAYYGAVLHFAEATCWFLNGWADKLMTGISQQMGDLDPTLIAWPSYIVTQQEEVYE